MNPKLDALTKDELFKIHEASLRILKESGVVFDNEEALEIFKKNGIKTDGKIVYIPEAAVENALKSAPRTYNWKARNEDHSFLVGETSQLGGLISAVNVHDMENGVRSSKLSDAVNVIKMHQGSDMMDFICTNMVEPTDIDPDQRHLYLTYETIKNCDKPFIAYNILKSRKVCDELLDLIEIACGRLDENNRATGLSITPSCPMKYESPGLQSIMAFSDRSQAVLLSCAAMTGITCPIDLLGAAVQQNVEILAGLVFTQLVNPGTPVVYHPSNSVGNLRFGSSAWGSPESMLICIPNFQMAMEIYNLPTRTIAGVTTARNLDMQAVIETMQSTMMTVLSKVHLIYCCCGVLDNIMTYSFEKHVIDEEIYSRSQCVGNGISFSDESLSTAVDTIQDVAHKDMYLTHASTFKQMRERWEPSVSVWGSSTDSGTDILANAQQVVKERLSQAPETLLAPELDKDLNAFIKKKSQ